MKNIVFLTGAGISVESGLTTFRGNGGMWDEYPVEQVASHTGWLKDPALVTSFYNRMRVRMADIHPNEAHTIMAEMEREHNVRVITQNVDDLHEQAGSHNVLHLHGELMKVCSSADVENPRYWRTLTPETGIVEPGTKAGDGSLLRPYIVFFEEPVPNIEPAIRLVQKADVMVVVGSSLVVYPAAGLIQYAQPGTPIYVIDPSPVDVTHPDVHFIRATASEGMRKLRDLLTKTT
ncbi:MAG: NAD-dependent protein deacylase [Bacteroidaceae bacterium]|nr:NAD-dependent protein deacylase [Bacteroidaceae bacterium]